MPYFRVIFAAASVLFVAVIAAAQGGGSNQKMPATSTAANLQRSSAAYAEVLLRKTELESDLESLQTEYTDEYPKLRRSRFELDLISKEADRLLAVKASDAAKLTEALGKLIVRKVELQGDLWEVQQRLGDGHPDVKRAKRKVEIYEKAIKEILG